MISKNHLNDFDYNKAISFNNDFRSSIPCSWTKTWQKCMVILSYNIPLETRNTAAQGVGKEPESGHRGPV